jgi:hypothetical protein
MSPSPDRFRVAISAAQQELLIREDAWATLNGLREEFRAALRELNFRLTCEANEWGESREHLPKLNIQMRCGTSRMITVLFGVDESRKLVFVKEFRINRKYRT